MDKSSVPLWAAILMAVVPSLVAAAATISAALISTKSKSSQPASEPDTQAPNIGSQKARKAERKLLREDGARRRRELQKLLFISVAWCLVGALFYIWRLYAKVIDPDPLTKMDVLIIALNTMGLGLIMAAIVAFTTIASYKRRQIDLSVPPEEIEK